MGTGDRDTRFQLSYLNKQLCVIVKVTPGHFFDLDPQTLENLLQRVTKKLEDEKSAGRIDRYVVSPAALTDIWPILKQTLAAANSDQQCAIRFAYGVKSFDQVQIDRADDDEAFCMISIDAHPAEIDRMNIIALTTYVKDYVLKKGWSTGSPDMESLKEAREFSKTHRAEPASIRRSSASEGLTVVTIPIKPKAKPKLKTKTVSPEKPNQTSPAQTAVAGPTSYPGEGILRTAVDPDGMAARITGFDIRSYNKPGLVLDETWLKREVQRLGVHGVTDDLLGRVTEKLERRQALNGLQVAAGTPGVLGKTPYLAPCTPGSAPEGGPPSSVAPLASAMTCLKGELIAEIRYLIPSVPGTNVTGHKVHPIAPEPVEVEIGEGAERVDSMHFRATQDGVLKIEGFKLSVLKAFVCEGDVTHNSGVINFKGNIHIKGNIESGASVTATGDITVDGSIRGGTIVSQGNLNVKGGISTGDKEFVRCRGELRASFIERATVFCKGLMIVENAIVQSRIYSSGDIQISGSEGRIGACTVYLWGNLTTAKLGFTTGATTSIHMGEDWRQARRAEIWKNRLNMLTERLEKDKNEERTLMRMKASQLNKKKLELKEHLRDQVARIGAITQRLEEKITELAAARKRNPAAKINVVYQPDGDTIVTIAGEPHRMGSPAVAS